MDTLSLQGSPEEGLPGGLVRSNASGIGSSRLGGNITVQGIEGEGTAATNVVLSGGSQIVSETLDAEGGGISITAKSLELSGVLTTISSSTAGTGLGGAITMSIQQASFSNGATITSSTSCGCFEGNPAGAGGIITVQGLPVPGTPVTKAESLTLLDLGSGFTSQSSGTGPLGNIEVHAKTVNLTDGAVIQAGAALDSAITAGNVTIDAVSVTISSGSSITSAVFGASGGEVNISANQLDVNNGLIATSTTGLGQGGDINIFASGPVTTTNGSTISAGSTGSGNAGRIVITTQTLNVDSATITTSTSSTGNAGTITANVGTLTLTNTAEISSSSTEAATGAAGSVTIQGLASPANAVTLTDSSLRTSADSTGRGGSITVDATNVTLNGATISASVKDVNADDGTDGPTSGLGNIALTSSTLNMTGGTVTAETSGTRNAGTITLTTTGNTLNVGGGGSITSSTSSSGNAGQILITSPVLSLNNGTITTSTSNIGNAGDITIITTGNTLSLANGSQISSASTGTVVTNPDSTTKVPGTAGTITITDAGSFTSDASTVATSAEANHGGDISITAQNVQLSNGTKIDASSNAPLEVTKLVVNPLDPDGPRIEEFVGFGDAGNITINSASNVVMQNSSVTTEASAASGGEIKIDAPDAVMVQLVNSRVSTSVGGLAGESDGGNITIDPQFVILQNSQIVAQAVAGAGGAIDIIATSAFIADPASIVDASSTLGISGEINIQSPLQNVGGRLTPLSQQFSSAAALLAQRCAARVADGKFSTFVVAGREGLPVEPGGFIASPSWTAELFGSNLSAQYPHRLIAAIAGSFPEYDARPIQLAKYGDACR